ncbi:amino acid decarboxylase [Zhengella mangrovi]|uniref:Amino acid decarboxylase n=2 Tax=Zhengella mangrovi TaxID=1982044 RepID=A0A2G1QHA1_9HYPH|nr:amino acid decarboxylase [Zhengella mangrovi]
MLSGRIEETLDPRNWDDVRQTAHAMVDDAIAYLADIRDKPVWQDMPEDVRKCFRGPVPQTGQVLEAVYEDLKTGLMPYPMGNIHPRFWMWYMGASNFTGALGDFLAAIVGSNLGGGNHAAALIDRQVVDWLKEMMGFPLEASGTLTSGGSAANLIALTVARNEALGQADIREHGLGGERLVFYGSDQLHGCHLTAMEMLGLGRSALRRLPSRNDYTLDLASLEEAIARDRAEGARPAGIIANAGTINTGAIDDLPGIAEIARREGLWFHVDGCIGALAAIAPKNGARLDGLERADSVALDPHKWLHAPFEVGCCMVRNEAQHRGTFALGQAYLEREPRGIAAADWLHDFTFQTSRGFRALKVWMSLKEHGVAKFGRLIDQNIAQAAYLAELIRAEPDMELLAEPVLDIVCFRLRPAGMAEEECETLNREIMLRLQETGVAALSDTRVQTRYALRCAIANHRTQTSDLHVLIAAIRTHLQELCGGNGHNVGEPRT